MLNLNNDIMYKMEATEYVIFTGKLPRTLRMSRPIDRFWLYRLLAE